LKPAYLDTQTAVWLHAGALRRLSRDAKREIERSDLVISPMALLEMEYLRARKRIKPDSLALYTYLHTTFGLTLCNLPFAAVIGEAIHLSWTDDPFDRIIVAQAKANHEASLITPDDRILENYPPAVW